MMHATNVSPSSKPSRWLKGAAAGALAFGFIAAASAADQPAEPDIEKEVVKLKREMQQVETRIQKIEQKAMDADDLKQARQEYVDALRQAAIDAKPDLKATFDRQNELIAELQGSPELRMAAAERSPEFAAKLEEFQKLRSEVDPTVQEVAAKPEMQEQFEEFQETVIEKMKEVEPETDELLAQRDQLENRYRELVTKMR